MTKINSPHRMYYPHFIAEMFFMVCKNKFRGCNYHSCASYAVAFGLGVTLSCFCPYGLILFISAILITALGIIVLQH